MESLEDSKWDVLIAGTGLHQSLLALALSRSGRKVLHVDENEFYGGDEAAFSLQEAETWAERHKANSPQTQTHGSVTIEQPVNQDAADSNRQGLGYSRAYSVSLSPQIVYSLSTLLPVLVSSKVYRQLEFLAVGSWWVYSNGSESRDVGSSTPSDGAAGYVTKIPSGREDVFADSALSRESKRSLMKFLRFVADYDDKPDIWEPYIGKPFLDFVTEVFKVSAELHSPLIALILSADSPPDITTEYALPRIARHLRSIGIFGPGFGSVLPKFGGLAEIAQVGCRASAVGGAVYILGSGLDSIGTVQASAADESPAKDPNTAASEPTLYVSAQLKGGVRLEAQWIVGGYSDLPATTPASEIAPSNVGQRAMQILSKSISVVSSPLQRLFPRIVEGSPPPAGAVVVFPVDSLPGTAANKDAAVHIFVHNSASGECPDSQSILYSSTPVPGQEGSDLLHAAVEALLLALDEKPETPRVLWSMIYEQHGAVSAVVESPVLQPTEAATNDAVARVIRFPRLSSDLAFDDVVLKNVREVWLKIMGEGATGFMEFEDREDMGEEYEPEDAL